LATEIKEEILKQEEKLIAPKNEEMEIEGNDHQLKFFKHFKLTIKN